MSVEDWWADWGLAWDAIAWSEMERCYPVPDTCTWDEFAALVTEVDR